jgi:hypothetical protein
MEMVDKGKVGEENRMEEKIGDNRLCSSAMGYCSRPRKAPEKVLLANRVTTRITHRSDMRMCGFSKDDAH